MKSPSSSSKSIFGLIADFPRLVIGQVKNEIEQLKQELIAKLKHIGIGVGLLAAAAFVGFFLLAVLIAVLILALATALPGWLAALIVAATLLLIMLGLALAGMQQLRQSMPPLPTETINSVKQDVEAINGLGRGNQNV